MPIRDPLLKGTATKDNIPHVEVKVSHFAHLGLGLALGAGLGLGIFFDLRIWAALGIKTNCSGIVYALGMPELVLDVSQP